MDKPSTMRIEQFILHSAHLIDENRLDEWLDCFEERSSYIVIPRDNHVRGFEAALMHCSTKARLADRVLCLQKANKVNPHYDRHILGGSLVGSSNEGIMEVDTNFMVVQTDLDGASKLFCAGSYKDRIRVDGTSPQIVGRRVIVDTFSVPTMLATPL
jgi:3-phenylpropionate/cinnamic acid dioxygenase small subunit